MRKNDLRCWGVWDPQICRLEYLSESKGNCEKILNLYQASHRFGLEIVRFDLCPLYRDKN